jgi:hypothetical protein
MPCNMESCEIHGTEHLVTYCASCRAALGGAAKSMARAEASRVNGAKGGRPRGSGKRRNVSQQRKNR